MKKLLFILSLIGFTTTLLAQCAFTVTADTIIPTECTGITAIGAIDLSVTGNGSFTYQWSNGANTQDITGLAQGFYWVTVTDTGGCFIADSFFVWASPSMAPTSQTGESCPGSADASIDITPIGHGPFSYIWSNGATTQDLTGLSAGTYVVTVTDAYNCTVQQGITITVTNAIFINISPGFSTCNADTGTLTAFPVGGNPPYTYLWSNGDTSQTADSLAIGNHTVTVTDSGGCTGTTTGFVSSPYIIQANVTGTDVTCNGLNDGTVNVFPVGGQVPYTYNWSTGDTGQFLTGLPAGVFTVTITDANGCSTTATGVVNSPSPIFVFTSTGPASCGNNNGVVNMNLTGGFPPYTFLWSNGATTQFISGLSAGVYCVTATDANGCTATVCDTVQSTSGPQIFNNTYLLCAGDTLFVQGSAYTQSGTYFDTIFSSPCDSIYQSFVFVDSGSFTRVEDSICAGDQYFMLGNPYGTNGTFYDTGIDGNGCDSIVELALVVFSLPSNTVNINACRNDTITISTFPIVIDSSFTYYDTIPLQGCDSVVIYQISVYDSVPVLSVTATDAECGSISGSAVLTVDSSVSYSIVWSTGDSGLSSLSSLGLGTYGVTVTDLLTGCRGTETFAINDLGAPTIVEVVTDAGCTDNSGSVTVSSTGGIPPYDYGWSNGATGATATGLVSGWYSVTVVDSLGCRRHKNIYVGKPANCIVTIGGYVIQDDNQNCTQDAGENGLPNVRVDLSNGSSVYTDANGYYQFTPTAGSYTVSQSLPSTTGQICPAAGIAVSLPTGGSSSLANNFYDTVQAVIDLGIFMSCGTPRPGFCQSVSACAANRSNDTVTVTITATYDPASTYQIGSAGGWGGNPTSINHNSANKTITWVIDMPPNSTYFPRFRVCWPPIPTVSLGQQTQHSFLMEPTTSDPNPVDNVDTCRRPLRGAYDPNAKEVNPGEGPDGEIDIDDNVSTLEYQIQFQNTGTDTAFNVTIKDTLDIRLDPSTFMYTAMSHPVQVSIDEQNIVTFEFPDIYLPDSNVDEPGSHGLINFFIDMDPNLPVGTQFFNEVSIYFDFNPPIVTNRAYTTIVEKVGIRQLDLNDFKVYPNPANDHLFVESESRIERLELYDALGRLVPVSIDRSDTRIRISLEELPAGNYLLRLAEGEQSGTFRLTVFR